MLPIDTDYGRDLYEMSNIFLHKVVWLGPRLSPGLSASPIYYYLYYPSLWLSGGDIRGPIYFNMLVTALCLLIFLYVMFKNSKYYILTILTALAVMTTPLWSRLATHPGNGFSYALFLFAGLATTYFTKNLWISALLFGVATAMHPASILALPILIGVYISNRASWKQILLGLAAYISPWTPIILFEFITKGFLVRQFMANPGSGLVGSQLHLGNLTILTSQLGLRSLYLTLALPLLFIFDKKSKAWEKLTLIFGLLFFMMVGTVPEHYLFGVAMTYLYVMIKWVLQHKKVALLVMTIWILLNGSVPSMPVNTKRPLYEIENNVSEIASIEELKGKKVAVVAVLPTGTSVPQADDYRGLLRMKGLNVVELSEHSQADLLIYIVEQPGFDYEHWSTWETEQFGKKKVLWTKQVGNALMMIWGKN